MLTARRYDALEETSKQCRGLAVYIVAGDIANEEFVCRLFATTIDTYGEFIHFQLY